MAGAHGQRASRERSRSHERSRRDAAGAEGPPPPQGKEGPPPRGEAMNVVATTMAGSTYTIPAYTSEQIGALKRKIAQQIDGVEAYQLRLVVGSGNLLDSSCIGDCAISGQSAPSNAGDPPRDFDGAEGTGDKTEQEGDLVPVVMVNVLVMPPIPEWAANLGFDGRHCAWLREHYQKHSIEEPDWLRDDASIWEKLQLEYDSRDRQKAQASSWGHRIWLEVDSEKVGHVCTSPGTTVTLDVNGWIWNNDNDTAIPQCGLAMGTKHLGQLSHWAHSRLQRVRAQVQIKAPSVAGAYMVYRFGELHYVYEYALHNFTSRTRTVPAAYPSQFVGWLVVE